jgi:hypothetical protein
MCCIVCILNAKKLRLCEKPCRKLKKAYSDLIPSMRTQVVVNINPVVLKNYCIDVTDIPKYYLSRT